MFISKVLAWILVLSVAESDLNVLHEDWKHFDKGIVDLTETLVKTVLPYMVRMQSQLDITEQCTSSILKLMRDLRYGKLWAAKMLDATGKPAGGLFVGNMNFYGSHSQCLSISVPEQSSTDREAFRGKYCLIKFKPKLPTKRRNPYYGKRLEGFDNVTFKSEVTKEFLYMAPAFYLFDLQIGVCLPSVCMNDDVRQISSAIFQKMKFTNHLLSCETTEETVWDWDQKAVFVTIIVFSIVAFGVTLLDIFDVINVQGVWKLLCVFSIRANTEKIFNSENSPKDNPFSCLYGMKVLSIGYVVLIHVYSMLDVSLYRESTLAAKTVIDISFQIIASAVLSVDTFIFITGVLMAYQIEKKGPKQFNIPVIFARRLWRLLPSAMLTLGLATILPLMATGPMWKNLTGFILYKIRKNWWTVLLCISNFYDFSEIPMIHLWYIAVDVQLFLMAMMIMFIYFRNRKIAYVVAIALGLTSMVATGLILYLKDTVPVHAPLVTDQREVLKSFYYPHYLPHNHISIYLIGMAIGLYFAKNPKVQISKLLARISWIVSLGLISACVFSPYLFYRTPETGPEIYFIFGCFHRTIWGLGLAIMTFLCATGHGGYISKFLSWTPFFVLGRLTYLVYLLHVLFIVLVYSSTTDGVDSKHPMLVCITFGVIGISFFAAYVVKVLFEAPLEGLEILLLSYIFPTKKETEDSTEKTTSPP